MKIDEFLNEVNKIEAVHFEGFVSGLMASSQPEGDLATSMKNLKWKDGKIPADMSSLITQGYVWNKGNEWGLTSKGLKLAKKRITSMYNPNKIKIK